MTSEIPAGAESHSVRTFKRERGELSTHAEYKTDGNLLRLVRFRVIGAQQDGRWYPAGSTEDECGGWPLTMPADQSFE